MLFLRTGSTEQEVGIVDELQESYSEDSQAITGLLRCFLLNRDVDVLLLNVCGEQSPDRFRPWFDKIARSANYRGPVFCYPWRRRLNVKLEALTANEVCSMLARLAYLEILPDRPALFGAGTFNEDAEKLEAYIAANEAEVDWRIDHVCKSLRASEWNKVIMWAERERIELAAQLELKPDSVSSLNGRENGGTTEGTKTATSGDTDNIPEKKPKRKFCNRCEQLKVNWFNRIRRDKEDVPLQTFLKEFFANPRKESIWKPLRNRKPTPTTWEAMEKKFRANEAQWKPEQLALLEELRGTIEGH